MKVIYKKVDFFRSIFRMSGNKNNYSLVLLIQQKKQESTVFSTKLSILIGLFILFTIGFSIACNFLNISVSKFLGIPIQILNNIKEFVFFSIALVIIIFKISECCYNIFSVFLSLVVILAGTIYVFRASSVQNYFGGVYILLGVSILLYSLCKNKNSEIPQIISLFLAATLFLLMIGSLLKHVRLLTVLHMPDILFSVLVLTYTISYSVLLLNPINSLLMQIARRRIDDKKVIILNIVLFLIPISLWAIDLASYYNNFGYNGIFISVIVPYILSCIILFIWIITLEIVNLKFLTHGITDDFILVEGSVIPILGHGVIS
ncbi:hypothetical protein [uncultured Sunxiuqinia sp.]|uniref:hypothetical protein n=1 Tax=uncultured Sunxiuqinia sp. TaxID=1573825 RepID=UPI002AA6D573|nr:hypothetical protein [uncultured Sunxiuqinia sp.]